MMKWMALSLALFAAGTSFEATSEATGRIEGNALCRLDNPSENIVVILRAQQVKKSEPPAIPVVVDQRNLRFIPHVLPILRGTTVAFPNSDRIQHNVFSASETQMFNLGTYSYGISRKVTFDKPGVVELLCNVHPEMSAYILVLETPYFATTDGRGFFNLENIPPGDYSLSFWCEHRGFISRKVSVKSEQITVIDAVLHTDEIKQAGREIPAVAGER